MMLLRLQDQLRMLKSGKVNFYRNRKRGLDVPFTRAKGS